jgi:hypothetical protein
LYSRVKSGTFAWLLVRSALLLLITIPIAVIGLVVNIWPLALVAAVNLLRVAPAVKATLKPAAGMMGFLIAWGIAGWIAFGESLVTGLLAIVALPLSLAALIYASERIVNVWRVARQWFKTRHFDQFASQIEDKRRAVVESVRKALDDD